MYYKKHKGELKSDLIALFVTLAISFVAAIVLVNLGVDTSVISIAMGVLGLVIAFFSLISKSVINLLRWIFGGK
ncbi:ABC transporter [Ligilactobacillus ruminis]|uniref:ABC transporter n=1 Tax=Ligilactobacillus ruminis TaxID=1623 RepID=UPI001472A806|nr:ABC transporter [Ligilactobacillus ruminis]NME31506.1 ABC transporter [Ligilactobacillus ruminis]